MPKMENETYNALSDYEYSSTSIATVMMVLGYSPKEDVDVSFDELIAKIRSVYSYKPSFQINSEIENYAVLEYLKSTNIMLSRVLRRSYFDLQISSYELKNDR
jgi:preprotein translocase subunit SecF